MVKEWIKTAENTYSFNIDNACVGTMHISINSKDSRAVCTINNNQFIIKRKGFWKSSISVEDSLGKVLIRTFFEKWFVHPSVLEYKTQKYKLVMHNNPMAGYAILDNSKTLLTYGLDLDNKNLVVKIETANDFENHLFDFLLWYLFVPVAIENFGDRYEFSSILA